MSETQKQLRRKRFGGVHPEDVSKALADLAKRNIDIARDLADARGREATLAEELDGFKSALRQVSSLLAIAEDRAGQIEEEARERAAEALREVSRLDETKQATIAELQRMRAQLDAAIGSPLRAVG